MCAEPFVPVRVAPAERLEWTDAYTFIRVSQ